MHCMTEILMEWYPAEYIDSNGNVVKIFGKVVQAESRTEANILSAREWGRDDWTEPDQYGYAKEKGSAKWGGRNA